MEKLVLLLVSVTVIVCLDCQSHLFLPQFQTDQHSFKSNAPDLLRSSHFIGSIPFHRKHCNYLIPDVLIKDRLFSSDGSHQLPLEWFAV